MIAIEELRVQLDGLRDRMAANDENMVRYMRIVIDALCSANVAGCVSDLIERMEGAVAHLQDLINELRNEVGEMQSVRSSVVALMDRLAEMVREHIDDPEELREILEAFQTERQALADAAARNTVAETEPEDPPVEPEEPTPDPEPEPEE